MEWAWPAGVPAGFITGGAGFSSTRSYVLYFLQRYKGEVLKVRPNAIIRHHHLSFGMVARAIIHRADGQSEE